nr:tandem-95 repeat protein [Gammaproteobacteria bacterium]
VTDDLGGTTQQIVNITLANVDDAAVITGDISYNGNEGDTVAGTISATDIEGLTDGTVYSVSVAAANGTAAIDPATGAWTFTPTDSNWFGTDSFTVTVTDDLGGTTQQIVNITLANVDDVAVITGDISYNGNEGDSVAGTINATDVEGLTDGTVYSVSSAAVNGAAAVNPATGAWTFSPTDPNWFGTDSFTVTVTDDLGGTTQQIVNITLANVDDVAVITGDISFTGNEGDTVTGTISATDIEGLTDGTVYTVSVAAVNGTASIDPATGAWIFAPTDTNWFGTDSFTVTVTDDLGGTTQQIVNITLANVDDAAVITGDISYTGNEGDTVAGTISATDVEGLTSSTVYTVTGAAANGTASIDPATGAWTFTPTDSNWFGTDSFTVTVTDDLGGTTQQLVAITLANIDDSAVISGNVTFAGNEGDFVTGTILATDIDGLTDGSLYSITTNANNGIASIDPVNGVWTFVPGDSNWFGTDSFTVTVTDDQGGITTQAVTITLANIDDAAVVTGDISYSGNEADTVVGILSATDIEGLTDGTVYSVGTAPAHGSAVINPGTGEWVFVPDDINWYGTDSFTVIVTDDLGGTTTQQIVISLNNVADTAVVSGDDTGEVTEDANAGTLVTTGSLTVFDHDPGEDEFQSDVLTGVYGTLTIERSGSWTHAIDNNAIDIQQLDVNETLNEAFVVTTVDGTTHTVSIDINGSEDAPVVTGELAGDVTKDESLTYSNVLTISDIDVNDNPIYFLDEANVLGDQGFGEFTLSEGVWTYALSNDHPVVQALEDNEFLNDTHTFVASDGTTQTVTVIIYGSTVPPVGGAIPALPETGVLVEEVGSGNSPEETEYEWLEAVVMVTNPEPVTDTVNELVESVDESETVVNSRPVEVNSEVAESEPQIAIAKERRSIADKPEPIEDLLALNLVLSPIQNGTQLDQYDLALAEKSAKETLRRATQSMREQMSDAANVSRQSEKMAEIALRVSGVSLSAGSLAWLLQSGGLFASALSSIPTWQGFDPLPVLSKKGKSRKWRFGKRAKSQKALDEKETVAGQILDSVKKAPAMDNQQGREG